MKVKVQKQPKNTALLTVTVGNADVKKEYDVILQDALKNTVVKGFRKGQAPKDLALKQIDENKLFSKLINTLLQKYYPQALKEHHLLPIANPKVEIESFDINKDFQFKATIALKPEVKVGDYKKFLRDLYKKKKDQQKILNAEKLKKGEPLDDKDLGITVDDVINALVEVTEVEVAELLIEEEVERMLSRLISQAEAVGITLDQYLKSQGKTAEQLRHEYSSIAEKTLKAEFGVNQLIVDLKITATDKEVEDMINAAGSEQAKQMLQNPTQRIYVKNLIEKNKVFTTIIDELDNELGIKKPQSSTKKPEIDKKSDSDKKEEK